MQAGHDVTIFEQAPELSEVGAGHSDPAPTACTFCAHIGVGDAVEAVGINPGAYVFRLHDTGEEIQRFYLSDEHVRLHGAPYVQVHRADFHQLLVARARALKPDIIRLGHRVTDFKEDADGVEQIFKPAERGRAAIC